MTIGSGIFFGLLFLGLVYLYVHTRDTWDWRKTRKRMWLGLAGVTFIGAIFVGGIFAWDAYEERLQVVKVLSGLSPGDTLADVQFKLGQGTKLPPSVIEQFPDSEDYLFGSTQVSVRNNTIDMISTACTDDNKYGLSANGIGCGAKGETIEQRFGADLRILCSKEKVAEARVRRVYDVPKYGMRFHLFQNEVRAISIGSPDFIASLVGFNWDKCN